ncbi:MAG: LapA family protein [Nitrosospira sp.]
MQVQLIVILIIVFLIVMFAVQNAVAVSVVFFLWRADASLAVVIAACFGLGAAIGALVTVPTMLRERISISRLRKDISILSAENDDLCSMRKDTSFTTHEF